MTSNLNGMYNQNVVYALLSHELLRRLAKEAKHTPTSKAVVRNCVCVVYVVLCVVLCRVCVLLCCVLCCVCVVCCVLCLVCCVLCVVCCVSCVCVFVCSCDAG